MRENSVILGTAGQIHFCPDFVGQMISMRDLSAASAQTAYRYVEQIPLVSAETSWASSKNQVKRHKRSACRQSTADVQYSEIRALKIAVEGSITRIHSRLTPVVWTIVFQQLNELWDQQICICCTRIWNRRPRLRSRYERLNRVGCRVTAHISRL